MKLIYIVLVFYEKYMTLIASIVFLRFVLLYMLHFIILLRILLKGQCRKRLAGTSNLFLPHIGSSNFFFVRKVFLFIWLSSVCYCLFLKCSWLLFVQLSSYRIIHLSVVIFLLVSVLLYRKEKKSIKPYSCEYWNERIET